MVDKDKLRYDLALNAAVVMTLRDNNGNVPDKLLIHFRTAYSQYGDKVREEELNKAAVEISNQNGTS